MDNLFLDSENKYEISTETQFKINSYLENLVSLNEQKEYDCFEFYEAIVSLNNLTKKNLSNEELKLFIEFKCDKLFSSVLKYYSVICNEFNYTNGDEKINFNKFNENADLNERRVSIFSNVLLILNQLLFKIVEFNLMFSCNDGLDSLFSLIKNENFLKLLSENDLTSLSCLINSLNLLSKYFDYSEEIKKIWHDSKISSVFIIIAQHFKIFKMVRIIYLILANISDEDTIQSLPEINQVVKSLVSDMNAFCNYFKTTTSINRIRIELMHEKTKEIKEYEVSFLNGKSLINVLFGLNKLATDPILKYRIWESNYCKTSLKYIILNGNEIERLYGLRLLNNLCLIDDVAEFVYDDSALKNTIEISSKNPNVKIEEIKRLSKAILDRINKNEIPTDRILIGTATLLFFFLKRFVFNIEISDF